MEVELEMIKTMRFPIVGRIKFNAGGGDVVPYLRYDMGYNISSSNNEHIYKGNGFLFNQAIGIDFRLNYNVLYFDVGYNLLSTKSNNIQSLAIKVGFVF